MQHVPQKRQSVRPTASVVIAAVVIAIALAAIWFGVSAAVSSGGDDCPAQRNATTERCH